MYVINQGLTDLTILANHIFDGLLNKTIRHCIVTLVDLINLVIVKREKSTHFYSYHVIVDAVYCLNYFQSIAFIY